MLTYLSDLETIVRTQIRDNGATQAFQNVELDQFIYDAIAQYSRYKPLKKPYTLSLVSGQASYTLPSDWIEVDKPSFDYAVHPRPNTALYGAYAYEFSVMQAIPANLGLQNIRFDWYDAAQTVTLSAAPQQAYTLNFDYFAMHQVTPGNESPAVSCTIPGQEQYIAMYWAAAQALDALITDRSDKLMVYKAKDVSVDNTEMVKGLEARAEQFRNAWQDEIMRRPIGQRGGDLSRLDWGLSYYGTW